MNKAVVVHAHFIRGSVETSNFEYDIEYQPTGIIDRIRDFFLRRTVQKALYNSGFKSDRSDFASDKTIDITRLNNDVNIEIENLNNQGYEIISITPITSGQYKYDFEAPIVNARDLPSYGWGYGFSYTCGVIVIAKKTKAMI